MALKQFTHLLLGFEVFMEGYFISSYTVSILEMTVLDYLKHRLPKFTCTSSKIRLDFLLRPHSTAHLYYSGWVLGRCCIFLSFLKQRHRDSLMKTMVVNYATLLYDKSFLESMTLFFSPSKCHLPAVWQRACSMFNAGIYSYNAYIHVSSVSPKMKSKF